VIAAFSWNMDVSGAHASLCRRVDMIFGRCYQQRASANGDENDAAIRDSCWNHVNKVLGPSHPNLWAADPLKRGSHPEGLLCAALDFPGKPGGKLSFVFKWNVVSWVASSLICPPPAN
jgi:hypothetical protein